MHFGKKQGFWKKQVTRVNFFAISHFIMLQASFLSLKFSNTIKTFFDIECQKTGILEKSRHLEKAGI